MKITCPHCKQAYNLDAEAIGTNVRCTACGSDFVVENPNLMPCPDCFALISRRAITCPHCGAPIFPSVPASVAVHEEDFSNEQTLLICHPAAKYYLLNLIIGIITMPFIIGLFILIEAYISIHYTDYKITTKRVMVKTGWLNKKQVEIWIKDMRGVNLQQDLWQRIIGTGSIFIGTAATAGAEIQMVGIADPQNIVDAINSLRKN